MAKDIAPTARAWAWVVFMCSGSPHTFLSKTTAFRFGPYVASNLAIFKMWYTVSWGTLKPL